MNKSNVISGIVALIVAAIVAYLLGGGQTIIREFGATPGDTVTGNFWNVGYFQYRGIFSKDKRIYGCGYIGCFHQH
ncbi:MAG: hypothetical protein UT82_C0028G0003 [Parcubacteria group bacterium GW2011_GWB1_40_14]|nr:MAG: hypothetical protein UT82_C0028G0003 [Parcubacteria group bacterium GW2011_GWB1_40_14]